MVVFYHLDEQVGEGGYSSKQEVVEAFCLMKQISHLDVEHVSG